MQRVGNASVLSMAGEIGNCKTSSSDQSSVWRHGNFIYRLNEKLGFTEPVQGEPNKRRAGEITQKLASQEKRGLKTALRESEGRVSRTVGRGLPSLAFPADSTLDSEDQVLKDQQEIAQNTDHSTDRNEGASHRKTGKKIFDQFGKFAKVRNPRSRHDPISIA